MHTEKTAIVVEGGAMRGIFATGILDEFIKQDFYPFDFYLGVSAGASNLAAYLGAQHGRNYKVYMDYCQRPNFKSSRRFLKGGNLIDVDWLWDITARELPMGLERIATFAGRFFVVATDAADGVAHYLSPNTDDLFQALKCSGNMPLFVKSRVSLYGKDWLDGGVADSIPVEYAYKLGAKKIMVLRSQHKNFVRSAYKTNKILPILLKNKVLVTKLQNRHIDYNKTLEFMQNPPADCKILQLHPPENIKLKQFTSNTNALETAYQAGIKIATSAINDWQNL